MFYKCFHVHGHMFVGKRESPSECWINPETGIVIKTVFKDEKKQHVASQNVYAVGSGQCQEVELFIPYVQRDISSILTTEEARRGKKNH